MYHALLYHWIQGQITSYICQLPLINVYATLGHHSWTQSSDLNVFLIDLQTQEWILMQFGGFFCFYCWYFWKRHIMEFSQKSLPFVIVNQTYLNVAKLVRLRAFSTHSVNV